MKYAVLLSSAAAVPLMTISDAIRSHPNLMNLMTDVNHYDNKLLEIVDRSMFDGEEKEKEVELKPNEIDALVKRLVQESKNEEID